MDDAPTTAGRLRWQADACRMVGSPLYGELLDRAALDVEQGGPVARALEGHEGDPDGSMLGLRLLGSVHRLVLTGAAPELARFYPSAGGTDSGDAWPAFAGVVEQHLDQIAESIDRPVQTNEVGRAGALVGGFLEVARLFGLPLRTLEVGASAGLLMRWDHYRYEARGQTWGPPDSPVRLCNYNSEKGLPFDADARVDYRIGCDRVPIDPTTEEGRLSLMSFVWPDQIDRFRLLKNALDVARDVPVTVERAAAAEWIEEQLSQPHPGTATVVYHSIVMQYLSDEERARFTASIESAGSAATEGAPLAWLRFEPGGEVAHVHLKKWPGGDDRLVATAGYHGTAVRWLG